MNPRRTGLFILAAAVAAMLGASTIDAEALAAMVLAPLPERSQGNPAAHYAPYNYPAYVPGNASWGSLFSAHWR
jgi:hypothetical protein